MAPIIYLTAVASTIFRIAGYLFLEVVSVRTYIHQSTSEHRPRQIPSGHLRRWIPTLYFAYLSGLYLSTDILSRPQAEIEIANGAEDHKDTNATPKPRRGVSFNSACCASSRNSQMAGSGNHSKRCRPLATLSSPSRDNPECRDQYNYPNARCRLCRLPVP